MRLVIAVTTLLTLGNFCGQAIATDALIIKWEDLAPKPEQYDNPFARLSSDQLDGLRKLLRHEQGGESPPEEVSKLRQRLESDGLNVDRLFAQRKLIIEKRQRQATATNDRIVGTDVRIPGYLLPLEIKDGRAVEFLLVPTVGACIHTPAPPPNQMVHVRYPSGFSATGLYSPIWVAGKLEAETRAPEVGFVDGRKQVEVGYVMNADKVEAYRK